MSDYLKTGYLKNEDVEFPKSDLLRGRMVAVTECVQEIPCNPCVESCPVNAISMNGINGVPRVDFSRCIGCGNCVAVCPGLAMFLVGIKEGKGVVSVPYEMLPLPEKGSEVFLLNRKGERTGKGVVSGIRKTDKSRNSVIVTVEFENRELVKSVRNIEVIK